MFDENWIIPGDEVEDTAEELSLEFDESQDPEAVWEWNGEVWAPVAAQPHGQGLRSPAARAGA